MVFPQSHNRRPVITWLIVFGIWTVPGLICSGQMAMASIADGATPSWLFIFRHCLPVWWVWFPVTFLITRLGRKCRISRNTWKWTLPIHIVAAIAIALLHIGFYGHWMALTLPGDAYSDPMANFISLAGSIWIHLELLAYGTVIGSYYALDYFKKFQERTLHASQLEAQLAQSHLRALKMQLHPHFLFNTLNAISTLVLKDNSDAALSMLTRLSDFLRMTLEERGVQEVPLEQELAFVEQYLAIEQVRFQDRLRVDFAVEPETLSAFVPNLILQPLVENAVRYAVAPRASGGCLSVRASRVNGQLRLQVQDDGPGLPSIWNGGIGLANTRRRLEELYGSDQNFAMENLDEGGLRVTLSFPFRFASDHDPIGKTTLSPEVSVTL